MQRVITTFFEGSFEKAVSAYLANHTGKMSDDELEQLADLINKARKTGG